VVIAYVSRLVTEKGLDVVVDATRLLGRRGIDHRMLFVGDGPERDRMMRALPDAIFEGHLSGEALATAYASSDIFLFPSETETFGNVTLEALASGLPAVVADATGSDALVKEGVNGFLVRPRDSVAFAERLESLSTDSDMRRRMGAAARSGALDHDWDVVLGKLKAYYEELDA
jgi:glycosyltransferase involved in cell wall biosynthesis